MVFNFNQLRPSYLLYKCHFTILDHFIPLHNGANQAVPLKDSSPVTQSSPSNLIQPIGDTALYIYKIKISKLLQHHGINFNSYNFIQSFENRTIQNQDVTVRISNVFFNNSYLFGFQVTGLADFKIWIICNSTSFQPFKI